ncbi:MAG: CaiB/BaiF CoA-transferase family protein [Acidimicrobiales bacterium]
MEEQMAPSSGEPLLAGVRVADLAGEPAQMATRILADLGAEVTKIEPAGGDPLREFPLRFAAWNAGKTSVAASADDPRLVALIRGADVVVDTPGWPGTLELDPGIAPDSVWVRVTPFGSQGPRAHWRASDLGVMASSGNMYSTGDPDRAPVRPTEPAAYAHAGPEVAFAALSGLASGRPHLIDVSMQEVVLVANMGAAGRYARTPLRGRRSGAQIGRTREIWPCADGFVSFGLRGGRARQANLETITRLVAEAGLGTPALTERDWSTYDPAALDDDDLRAIEDPVAGYFASRTMAELYEIACETNLMLAPANSPRELYASAQLASRGFFGPLGDFERFPLSFVQVRSSDGMTAPARPRATWPELGSGAVPAWPARLDAEPDSRPGRPGPVRPPGAHGSPTGERGGAWEGTRLLEFGSGAAGPIATRYFAEHGATVIRVESRSRPDFLRAYGLGPNNPHGLEGSAMFDALNPGKLDITLNLKHPRGHEIARRLALEWADGLSENFAPKAMKGLGLDYESLAADRPDLVMVSACLQGQTGPHRNYPGFGGQGSALAGYNFLTGWPDRAPLGPHGTITDSLAPRFSAAALAAGLLYRRRTGRGVHLDLSQVEAAAWTLSPWLLEYENSGVVVGRDGNRSRRACPHGAFSCTGEDRWVAIAIWTDDEWRRLCRIAELDQDPSLSGLDTLGARMDRVEEIEAALDRWTRSRVAEEVAALLQASGIEAVPVLDFADLYADTQLAAREHLQELEHPLLGRGAYERNGFRLSDAPSGYKRASPTLGQDNFQILGELLGLSAAEQSELAESGALE